VPALINLKCSNLKCRAPIVPNPPWLRLRPLANSRQIKTSRKNP